MALPQTAAGVGAIGIDPTDDLLAKINTVGDIFDWLGSAEPLQAAVIKALGGGSPKLRDLVFIDVKDWSEAVASIRVDGADGARAMFPIERGHVAMVRRIARLRLGLTAIDEISPTASNGSAGRDGVGAITGDGAAPPIPVAEPRLKLSVIIDPSMDSELVRLPGSKIRHMFTEYEKTRGAEPTEEIEPTVEQISAVKQVLDADLVPYADFSLFGPYGERFLQKLTLVNWSYLPDGSWQRRELPGPPTLEHWWASFRVLRTTYLLLDTVATEILDNYGEMVRGFHAMYGPQAWFIIYTADVRMRSENFERLRRHAERDHEATVQCGGCSTFDVTKPWNTVFAKANADKDWWNDNLHRPAMLYLTRIQTAAAVVDDGTSQPALDHYGSGSAIGSSRSNGQGGNKGGGGRGRSPRKNKSKILKNDKKICFAFNGNNGCSRRKCNDLHHCSICQKPGHNRIACFNNQSSTSSPSWGPPKGGKGERTPFKAKGGKGKGKRGH